jgi:hypothetical protein
MNINFILAQKFIREISTVGIKLGWREGHFYPRRSFCRHALSLIGGDLGGYYNFYNKHFMKFFNEHWDFIYTEPLRNGRNAI